MKQGEVNLNLIDPLYEQGEKHIIFAYKGKEYALSDHSIEPIEINKILKFSPHNPIDDKWKELYRKLIYRRVSNVDLLEALL